MAAASSRTSAAAAAAAAGSASPAPGSPGESVGRPSSSAVPGLENYTVGRAIGRGHFSVVYKCKDNRTKNLVALKKIRLFDIPPEAREKTLKEVELLRMVEHPNIVRCFESFTLENDLIIVCEYAELGDMAGFLKRQVESGMPLDEPRIWNLFFQIASAVQHMHRKRVMHRDIKPSNILMFPNDTCKLADLGLGRMLTESIDTRAHSRVGTPLYMAPEVVLSSDGYGFASDLWSLGCVLYELAAGVSPFKSDGLTLIELVRRVRALQYPPLPDTFSETLRSLVQRLLVLDPAARPGIDETVQIAADMLKQYSAVPSENIAVDTLADMLHDKLKLLNYEAVCRKAGVSPPPALAFATAFGHPPAQFALYARLAGWLCCEAGAGVSVDPHDPPATVAAALRQAVTALRPGSVDLDPVRLQKPHGLAACQALLLLAEAALQRRGFAFVPPVREGGHGPSGDSSGSAAAAAAAVEEQMASDSDADAGAAAPGSHGVRNAPDTERSDDEAAAPGRGAASPMGRGPARPATSGGRPATAGTLRPSTTGSFGSAGRADAARLSLALSPSLSRHALGLPSSPIISPSVPDILPGLQGELAQQWRAEAERLGPRLVQESLLGTSLAALPALGGLAPGAPGDTPATAAATAAAVVPLGASFGLSSAESAAPSVLWRMRVEGLSRGLGAALQAQSGVESALLRLVREVGAAVEAVRGKERLLSTQLADTVQRVAQAQQALRALLPEHSAATVRVAGLADELHWLGEECAQTEAEISERLRVTPEMVRARLLSARQRVLDDLMQLEQQLHIARWKLGTSEHPP